MALRSLRFAGDARLEAAATSDPKHILPGATGAHVAKIQSALIELDGAPIQGHELASSTYGPSTAAAVLAFKTRRDIVNRSYQTTADNIVGKMTMAALDAEIAERESAASDDVRLEPVFPQRRVSDRSVRSITSGAPSALSLGPRAFGQAASPSFDTAALDIPVFGVGTFQVVNGVGGVLVTDPNVAAIFTPGQLTASNFVPVTANPQTFSVRGLTAGATLITFQRLFLSPLKLPLPIIVVVRSTQRPRRPFTKGIEHNHPASRKWSEVSADPRNALGGADDGGMIDSVVMTRICKNCSTPKCAVDTIVSIGFGNLPIARDHINWYLTAGNGRDFDEDGNVLSWLRLDSGIRRALRREIDAFPDKLGKKTGHFEFSQGQYDDQDFRNAFGGIDRVDFEFDFDLDECTVWFQDRYEWHPVYKGLYQELDGDDARATNCAHAAFVEMKLEGARDFWMVGQATVPIATILRR